MGLAAKALLALPLALSMAGTAQAVTYATPPTLVSGPLAETDTDKMYPGISLTADAKPVTDYPYVTEEYFVSGTAAGQPYKTRMLVRRPQNIANFSGIVVAEAMHTNGRALIFEWSHDSILTRGHIFVEIPTAAVNVASMKTFNPTRYASLSIPLGSQANDIIAQFGALIKSNNTVGGWLATYPIRHVTLMGTSASSGIVRTWLPLHPTIRLNDGKNSPVYDGYLLTSTNGNTKLPYVDVPMIQMPTQTEVFTWAEDGIQYRRPDGDEAGDQYRLYEVAGMAHNNSRENPGFLGDPCTLPVSNFPAGAFTALALNHLLQWIDKGIVPPHAPGPMATDGNTYGDGSFLTLDENSNATGGIRNVYVDVPTSTFGVFGSGKFAVDAPQSEKDRLNRLCLLVGTEVKFDADKLKRLYPGGPAEYKAKVEKRLDDLIAQGWFLPEYKRYVEADIAAAKIPAAANTGGGTTPPPTDGGSTQPSSDDDGGGSFSLSTALGLGLMGMLLAIGRMRGAGALLPKRR
jgi:hypothetical protein